MPRRASILLVTLMFIPGCVMGVAWMPDSSGFYYTTPSGKLLAYDIKAKKSRLVWADAAARDTVWPALSADGKRIALAHVIAKPATNELAVAMLVVDPQGVIEVRSAPIALDPPNGKNIEYAATVFWSPDAKKLLAHVHGTANQGQGVSTTVLFDIDAKTAKTWPRRAPAVFGNSPIRPDGKGFLLARDRNGEATGYAWVDWQGTEKPIRGQTDKLDPPSVWTALANSRWDGARAILSSPDQRITIDTDKLELTTATVKRADIALGKEVIRLNAKLAGGGELLVLDEPDDNNKSGPPSRVAFRKTHNGPLVNVVPKIRDRMILLSAAPNGKHAIVRVSYGPRGRKGDTIHVIDAAGTAVDLLEIDPKE